MKLIICSKCSHMFNLSNTYRVCECGASAGNYTDDLNAVIYGKAIPVGFANYSFICAVKEQPQEGMGKEFTAFVIPKQCPTIEHKSKLPKKK